MVKVLCVFLVSMLCLAQSGCAVGSLVSYVLWPDYPSFRTGESVHLQGLTRDVSVTRRADGLWRVSADNELDGMRVLGYLQARDRMAQLDLFRHLARGEVAMLVGDRPFAGKRSVDADRLNRFLGFRRDAALLYEYTSNVERASLDAFVSGINAWIAEGRLSLEHRLLGVDVVRPWTADDSLAIYLMIMHGLGGNADREIRRLALACAGGIDAMERIWPTDLEYDVYALPPEDLESVRFATPPGVVPEVAEALPELCRLAPGRETARSRGASDPRSLESGFAAAFETFRLGWSASNNWAVAGRHTKSGRAIFSSDPHLPHMNPPMIWGFDFETPEYRSVGFTLPGLYRVVFGHNGSVAWGATTNHVDRQDLVLHKSRRVQRDGRTVEGYELDGEFVEFEVRSEEFQVRGGETVKATVRFTRDGPLLNDLTDDVEGIIPLVALRTVPFGRGIDLDGARVLTGVSSVREFAEAIDHLDLGCSSWIAADSRGSIGYRSPCLLPVRDGWRGTFPIPGWLSKYDWQGMVPKASLPTSFDPARGWLATANNQIVPTSRYPTTYNNDVSAPDRYSRIVARLQEALGSLDVDGSASIQMDLFETTWARVRPTLEDGFCVRESGDSRVEEARTLLCDWGGEMSPDSAAATVYTLLTLSILDHGLADDLPEGELSEVWSFVQSLVQFEVAVRWLWTRPAEAPVWDDSRTAARETRDDILEVALRETVSTGVERFGGSVADWRWGEVRPFVLEHPFAGDNAVLGRVLNSPEIPIGGGNETVFKHQFPRSNRQSMKVAIGPIVRLTVDLGDPWAARFALAGGQSGWARSPYYGNLLQDWASGEMRPLTPATSEDDISIRFVATSARRE